MLFQGILFLICVGQGLRSGVEKKEGKDNLKDDICHEDEKEEEGWGKRRREEVKLIH